MLGIEKLRELESQFAALEALSQSYRDETMSRISNCRDILASHKTPTQVVDRVLVNGTRSVEKHTRPLRSLSEDDRFILLLVDGDQYTFHKALYEKRRVGGAEAATLLKIAVSELECAQWVDDSRTGVLVRIYANFGELSKELARLGFCGREARSITPFVAGFNATEPRFEYIDAGMRHSDVEAKVKSTFKLFVKDRRCAKILFAGCLDHQYQLLLEHHKDKVIWVKALDVASITLSNLEVQDLSSVFCRTLVPAEKDVAFNGQTASHAATKRNDETSTRTQIVPEQTLCKFHVRGKCLNGLKCKFKHNNEAPAKNVVDPAVIVKAQEAISTISAKPARRTSPNRKAQSVPPTAKTGQVIAKPVSPASAPSPQTGKSLPIIKTPPPPLVGVSRSEQEFERKLPAKLLDSQVPIDARGYRLDTIPRDVDKFTKTQFWSRSERKKLCNAHHLTNDCTQSPCPLDHSQISAEMRDMLLNMARSTPCSKRGKCRSAACTWGHVCLRKGCDGGGKCRFERAAHEADMSRIEWVPAVEEVEKSGKVTNGHSPGRRGGSSGPTASGNGKGASHLGTGRKAARETKSADHSPEESLIEI